MDHSTTEVPADKGLNRVIKIDDAQINNIQPLRLPKPLTFNTY